MKIARGRLLCRLSILGLLLSCRPGPPDERGPFTPSDLVEIVKLDTTIRLDIRYATANNLVHTPVYSEARAFLQRPAAEALVRVHHSLLPLGYGLLVFDGYRPWSVTKKFWDLTPEAGRKFTADPKKGSRHNRGCAVDCTLYDLSTGREVNMPGTYDEMTERSYPGYTGGTESQRHLRDLLRASMEKEGFTVFPYEWWHYDYKEWSQYRISDIPFQDIH